jgi:restriction system protein
VNVPSEEAQSTPEETLEASYVNLRQTLAEELIDRVKKCPPKFFEKLVVDLLVSMGYGGSRKDAGQAVGQSGDDGIDGIIKEDKLGLDVVYLQAKRWEATVGRPVVQAFAGSLEGQRARKGVLITTSQFSQEAKEIRHSHRKENHTDRWRRVSPTDDRSWYRRYGSQNLQCS